MAPVQRFFVKGNLVEMTGEACHAGTGVCGSTEDPDPTEEGPLRTQYWRGIRHLEDEDEMRELFFGKGKWKGSFLVAIFSYLFLLEFLSQTGEDSTQ